MGHIEHDLCGIGAEEAVHHGWAENAPSVGEVSPAACGASVQLAMFASNDYLGLSTHPAVRAAAAAAAAEFGCGPRSSAA